MSLNVGRINGKACKRSEGARSAPESCAAAWRGYKKDKNKTKRASCEKAARKAYGAKTSAKKSASTNRITAK